MILTLRWMRTTAALLLALSSLAPQAADGDAKRVLNVAFRSPESTLDPAKMSDLYSRTISPHIFEALYQYDHLARPIKVRPLLADGMPTASADFRTWTIKVKPGIYFTSDPAFKGAKREVTAQDFVYPYQRIADPANKSPLWGWIDTYKLLGLAEARKAALDREALRLRRADRGPEGAGWPAAPPIPTARVRCSVSTPPRPAGRTWRASRIRAWTQSTSSSRRCPTAASARRCSRRPR